MTPRQIITILAIALCYVIVMCLASCSHKSYSGIVYNCSNDTVMCEWGKFKILNGSKPCGKMVTFKATLNRKKINAKRIH